MLRMLTVLMWFDQFNVMVQPTNLFIYLQTQMGQVRIIPQLFETANEKNLIYKEEGGC